MSSVNLIEPVDGSFFIQGASGLSAIGMPPFVDVNACWITEVSTQGIILGGLMNGNEKLGLSVKHDYWFTKGVFTYVNELHKR